MSALGIDFLLCAYNVLLLQLILQSHVNDDQRLALTGVPLLPVNEHCFVSSPNLYVHPRVLSLSWNSLQSSDQHRMKLFSLFLTGRIGNS